MEKLLTEDLKVSMNDYFASEYGKYDVCESDYMNHYSEYLLWMESRKNLDYQLVQYLMSCGINVNDSNCYEIGKTFFDSVAIKQENGKSKIVTPYLVEYDDLIVNPRIIPCDKKLVYVKDEQACINSHDGQVIKNLGLNKTYFMDNPNHEYYKNIRYGWLPIIHNCQLGNIIMSVHGLYSDKDSKVKIEAIAAAREALDKYEKGFFSEVMGENDAYYIVVASTDLVKVKQKVRSNNMR